MLTFTLEELAGLLNGSPSERPGPGLLGVRPLEFAGETDITYVTGSRYLPELSKSAAGAVLIPPDLERTKIPFIRVSNPEAAFAHLTGVYYGYPKSRGTVSPRADIHPEARLGHNVAIGAFCVVGKGSSIGDNTVLVSNVVVGEDVRIGADTRIFPNVTIYPGVTIGDRVIIHSGTVIGSDGFGFAMEVDRTGIPVLVKKYHSGTVEIEDDVELGALCAVDRGLAGVTRLGKGVKVDNLVQIAHNVRIGDGTAIASQTGIAGSSSVGRHALIGGQVGIKDHVDVGNRVVLATRVGIYRSVPDGSVMAGGVPAMPHKVFLRAAGLFKRLPEMLDRIRKIERLLGLDHKEI